MPDFNDQKTLEKYSSAVSLSDMEIFIFPELIYSLVLANIMSPLPWQWKENDWFQSTRKMKKPRQLLRLRQFIMDNFCFNLDLDTWGLTTKEQELNRFRDFVNQKALRESNALFGYEGDKYYFDLNIRKHFGLDKYTSDTIPYWKTETVEAMHAFRHKPGFSTGAGECVSLSTLYAAMLFVTVDIPLDQIYLMATPLHSQNFLDINGGVLTNNRRLVTKSMWFNGTELSARARRALENEKITIIANNSGYIHTLYDEATMNPNDYRAFSEKLGSFLKSGITPSVLAGFLRHFPRYQHNFQITRQHAGKTWYIEAENVFHYEHSSSCKVGDKSQTALLKEIGIDEFYPEPIKGRADFKQLQLILQQEKKSFLENLRILRKEVSSMDLNLEAFSLDLENYTQTSPALPEMNREWISQERIDLSGIKDREGVIEYLNSIRDTNQSVDLAFSAYRDLTLSPWKPFLKAAFERNPVFPDTLKPFSVDQAFESLDNLDNSSIYDNNRLAQPDEVWNFGRGDGLEKALCFLNLLISRGKEDELSLDCDKDQITVSLRDSDYVFKTEKKGLDLEEGLKEAIILIQESANKHIEVHEKSVANF